MFHRKETKAYKSKEMLGSSGQSEHKIAQRSSGVCNLASDVTLPLHIPAQSFSQHFVSPAPILKPLVSGQWACRNPAKPTELCIVGGAEYYSDLETTQPERLNAV